MDINIQEDYIRKAKLIRVIDGDTFEVEIDLGFSILIRRKVRLFGVDCPEMKGPHKDKGLEAKDLSSKFFIENHGEFLLLSHSDKIDNFGRILAEVWDSSGKKSLADILLNRKLAEPFIK